VSLAKKIFRMKLASAGLFTESISEAQRLITNAGRFSIDQNVMDAVERMERTPFGELLGLLEFAKLPFPTSWFEWGLPGGGGHIGYLCEALPDFGFAFRQYLSFKGMQHLRFERLQQKLDVPVVCTFGRIRVEANGWIAESQADVIGAGAPGQNHLQLAAGDVLRLLLMINSPSQIVEIGPGDDNRRIDAIRAERGRPPLPNLRPIRFDIGRFRRAEFANGAPPANQREVAEHFVRGHFKIRKTGMFWWSPHVRYQMGEGEEGQPAVPRDYKVGVTEPE
jgi:hypothetical protein